MKIYLFSEFNRDNRKQKCRVEKNGKNMFSGRNGTKDCRNEKRL